MFLSKVSRSRSLFHLQSFRFFAALPIEKELEEFAAVCEERGFALHMSQNGAVVTAKTAQREPLHIEVVESTSAYLPVVPTIIQELRELRQALQAQEARSQELEARSQEQELKIKALQVHQKYTGKFMVSITIRELVGKFRELVWRCKHPRKSYDAEMYNKWIMSKSHQDEDTVPFVDKLLPPGAHRFRELLTWRTLRVLTYHPSRSHPKRADYQAWATSWHTSRAMMRLHMQSQ